MQRNKKIPILNDFTPQGLLIIGLIALGGLLIIGAFVAILVALL